jgi:hypothetical protein
LSAVRVLEPVILNDSEGSRFRAWADRVDIAPIEIEHRLHTMARGDRSATRCRLAGKTSAPAAAAGSSPCFQPAGTGHEV